LRRYPQHSATITLQNTPSDDTRNILQLFSETDQGVLIWVIFELLGVSHVLAKAQTTRPDNAKDNVTEC